MSEVSGGTLGRWVLEAGWVGADAATAWCVAKTSGADPDAAGGIFGLSGAPPKDGAAQAKAAHARWAASGWAGFPGHAGLEWVQYWPTAVGVLATVDLGVPTSDVLVDPLKTVTDIASAPGKIIGPALDEAANVLNTIRYAFTDEGRIRLAKFGLGMAFTLAGAILIATRGTKAVMEPVLDSAEKFGTAFTATAQGVQAGRNLRASGALGGAQGSPWSNRAPSAPPQMAPGWRPAYRARHSQDDTPTVPISEKVGRTRGILGREEARKRAPITGTAKVEPQRLPKPLPSKNAGKPRTGMWRNVA